MSLFQLNICISIHINYKGIFYLRFGGKCGCWMSSMRMLIMMFTPTWTRHFDRAFPSCAYCIIINPSLESHLREPEVHQCSVFFKCLFNCPIGYVFLLLFMMMMMMMMIMMIMKMTLCIPPSIPRPHREAAHVAVFHQHVLRAVPHHLPDHSQQPAGHPLHQRRLQL